METRKCDCAVWAFSSSFSDGSALPHVARHLDWPLPSAVVVIAEQGKVCLNQGGPRCLKSDEWRKGEAVRPISVGLNLSTKKTRKRESLAHMEKILPCAVLVQIVAPHNPKSESDPCQRRGATRAI